MDYLLVLQFPGKNEDNFNLLIEMEEKLEQGLGSDSMVDGHDFGSDEMNIFIFTAQPEICFDKSMKLITGMTDINTMKAAYRHVESEKYIILWPMGLTGFEVK